MSIGVTVAVLSAALQGDSGDAVAQLRKDFRAINRLLQKHGFSQHREPESLPPLLGRSPLVGFPSSCLQDLRLVAAYQRRNLPMPALSDDYRAVTDPVLQAEYRNAKSDSHLINHSDCDGYYVPIQFTRPLVDSWFRRVPGSILGSSHGLYAELQLIAPAIGVHLIKGTLPDPLADALADEDDESIPFAIERLVWFTLFEAASLSLGHGTAIRFA